MNTIHIFLMCLVIMSVGSFGLIGIISLYIPFILGHIPYETICSTPNSMSNDVALLHDNASQLKVCDSYFIDSIDPWGQIAIVLGIVFLVNSCVKMILEPYQLWIEHAKNSGFEPYQLWIEHAKNSGSVV